MQTAESIDFEGGVLTLNGWAPTTLWFSDRPDWVAGQRVDPDVVVYLLVIAVVGLVILMPAAGELGKRSQATGNKAQ